MMNEVLDILFQVLIVSPSMQRILQPGKYSRTRGICYAVLFLATIAIGRVSYEMMDQKANYYQALKVDRDCTLSDLKRGYRAQSVTLHPDKNPSPSAADDFNRLREAFDVLSDDTKRKVYDLFGEEAAQDFNGGEEDVLSLDSGVQFISFYVLWGVLTYLFTMGAGSSPSRTWVYCACMLTFITELNLTYGKMQLPKYFSRTATFQAISMLHSMYPLVLNGCRSLGGFLHFDMLEENFAISLELLQANKVYIFFIAAIFNLYILGHISVHAGNRYQIGNPWVYEKQQV